MNCPYLIIHDPQKSNWLLFKDPVDQIIAHEHDSIIPCLNKAELLTEKGYYAAGFLTYEASPAFEPEIPVFKNPSLPLIWLGIFRNPYEISLEADTQSAISPLNWTPLLTRKSYNNCIAEIKEYILSGDTYQVNYTFDLKTDFNHDTKTYFESIVAAHPAPYAAYVNTGKDVFCSFSPELFFRKEGDKILCRPMKGTSSRGRTCEEDRQKSNGLYFSQKNRAENLMIVDMIRNDCGRIAKIGSVEVSSLFDIEKYRTVYQMTSTIKAYTSVSVSEIFKALFPCASISGAPKIRTSQIIYELEKRPRGIYCGSIGYMAPEKKALFNIAIRTVHVKIPKSIAVYSVGSGIVWDSQSDDEYSECINKADIVSQPLPVFDLFETILYTPEEGYFLFDEHLDRCSRSCFYWDFPVTREIIKSYLNRIKAVLPLADLKIRLVISKNGTINHTYEPFFHETGIVNIGLAKRPVDSSDPYLYHKTTNRAIYKNVVEDSGAFDDFILWNERDEITETTLANLVIKKGNKYLTPALECGLLPGTFRSNLLKDGLIEETVIKVNDIYSSNEIFRINSVRKWQKCNLSVM